MDIVTILASGQLSVSWLPAAVVGVPDWRGGHRALPAGAWGCPAGSRSAGFCRPYWWFRGLACLPKRLPIGVGRGSCLSEACRRSSLVGQREPMAWIGGTLLFPSSVPFPSTSPIGWSWAAVGGGMRLRSARQRVRAAHRRLGPRLWASHPRECSTAGDRTLRQGCQSWCAGRWGL